LAYETEMQNLLFYQQRFNFCLQMFQIAVIFTMIFDTY